MSGRRFMIRARMIRDGYASFDGELFNHIVRVLRLGTGDEILLVDEHGTEHRALIDQINREWVAAKIVSTEAAPEKDHKTPRITVCQALPKGDKIDLILQKGTELGVHDFRIFAAARSVAKVRIEKQNAKLERWNKIVTEAARQCCRRTVPAVNWHGDVNDLCSNLEHDLQILLWEAEQQRGLKQLINNSRTPETVAVAIGPEGGFEASEAELLIAKGFHPVTLGRRIVRTETAALATVSILQYIWDDI